MISQFNKHHGAKEVSFALGAPVYFRIYQGNKIGWAPVPSLRNLVSVSMKFKPLMASFIVDMQISSDLITNFNHHQPIVGHKKAPMFGRPPQDVVCLSNRLYGLVEDTSNSRQIDRTTWLTVDVFSSSPQDCIKQCYGYRFCYSVRYTFTGTSQAAGYVLNSPQKIKTCRFFLHASDNCANQKLTSLNEISNTKTSGDIFVDCLKCADEDKSKGENYIKKSQPYYVTSHPLIEFNEDETPKSVQKQSDWLVIQRDQVSNDTEANLKFRNTIDEAQNEGKSPTTSAPAYATACLVTFQVFKQTPLNRISVTKVATVSSLNECAYICYQNACTHAIYEPPTQKEAGTSTSLGEAKCSLEMGQKETCDNHLQRHYSFKTTQPVVLSCLRCGPKKPVTVSHEAEWVTPRPSSVVSSKDETTATAPTTTRDKGEGTVKLEDVPSSISITTSSSTATSTTPLPKQAEKSKNGPTIKLENGCFTTFQGDSLNDRPKEFTSVFELELEAESVEVCAQKCYQDGCTGALFHTDNSTCVLGYGDKYWCKDDSPETAKYRQPSPPLKVVWIHCVGCRNEVNRKTGVVETAVKEKPVSPVEAQLDGVTQTATPTSSAHTMSTSESPIASSPEGVQTTAEASMEGTAQQSELSSTPPAPEKTTKSGSDTQTIANTSTAEKATGLAESNETPSMAFSSTSSVEESTTATTYPDSTSSFPQSPAVGQSVDEEKGTSISQQSQKSIEKSTAPSSISTTTFSSTATSTTLLPKQAEKSKNGPTIKLENGCFTTFQGDSLNDRPKEFTSVFELELEAESVEVCAQKCYQDGCTGALFHTDNSTCVLGYGDKYWCKDDSPETAKYRQPSPPLKVVWIHCVGCSKL
uniref:Apple domain-containing protein n=1 Tax=Ditylenchus dipsaci TaxID=166011 RepID=A0A915CVE3_9BILA